MAGEVTNNQRLLLRGLAAVATSGRSAEKGGWWSVDDLTHAPATYRDFRGRTAMSLTSTGRTLVARGLAESRRIGAVGSGWVEYRITDAGRELVADSCIGGGLDWARVGGGGRRICPACRQSRSVFGAAILAEVPAHPLPARSTTTTAREN